MLESRNSSLTCLLRRVCVSSSSVIFDVNVHVDMTRTVKMC